MAEKAKVRKEPLEAAFLASAPPAPPAVTVKSQFPPAVRVHPLVASQALQRPVVESNK